MTNIQYPFFEFRVSIRGIKKITDELEDALWEAGATDAIITVTKGIVSLTYNRQCTSMGRALAIAEKEIESVTLRDGTRLSVRGLHIVGENE
jgi:hypothetical protein